MLIYVRFLFALIFFVLCCAAFWHQFYPFKIFDIQFTAALQSGLLSGFGLALALFLCIVLLTLLFGRVYCAVLCPLGFYQEILTFLFKPFYKKRSFQIAKHHTFSYLLAAILFGTLFGGTVILLRMLDPYSVFANALSGACFGVGFLVFLAVLVFFKKRFFCTNICPVGTVLGFISRFAPFQIRINTDKCKVCSLCAKSCPCGAIDFKNHTVNNKICVRCFKCLPKCEHGALYYGLQKTPKAKFSLKRREFLKAGLVLAVFGTALKGGIVLSQKLFQKLKQVILPAGADNPQDFANRCLNCNLCVQNCPMKIIKPATIDTPFVHLEYGNSYCRFDCHRCSSVCPSGAIKRLTLIQKQHTKIANAVINEDMCIKCGVCSFECPKKIIIKQKGKAPVIQFDKCIGCGKCATVCPVKAILIEPVDAQISLNIGEK